MIKYEVSDQQLADIAKRFKYHPPKDDQPERYVDIRDALGAIAIGLCQQVPEGRELSLALTNLEQCCMWANAGIARGE